MSLGGILLGLVNIAIVVVILLIFGVIALWILRDLLHITPPANLQQLYLALVALIALYMLIALFFSLPSIHIIGGPPGPIIR